MTQISFRAEINEYTNRVLGVIKEKYGLKTKSEALNVFALQYGEKFVEKEIKEELIRKVQKIATKHDKKHSKRTMTLEELDKLCGIKCSTMTSPKNSKKH
ncbi:MAG: DUF2683 family protein [Candidatus Nanoarchaeia archaeon]